MDKEVLLRYLDDFLSETEEYLSLIDSSLLRLENEPESKEEINTTFRQLHSLKGLSGALGFENMTRLCHTAESLMSRFRDNKESITAPVIKTLFSLSDLLRSMREQISKTLSDEGFATEKIIADIEELQNEFEKAGSTKKRNHLSLFLQELSENIDKIDSCVVTLEKSGYLKEEIDSLFRMIHNTKGIAHSLGFKNIEKVSHSLEGLLEKCRGGDFAQLPTQIIEMLFEYNDLLRKFMVRVEKSSADDGIEISDLVNRAESLIRSGITKSSEISEEQKKLVEKYLPDYLDEFNVHLEILRSSIKTLEKDNSSSDGLDDFVRQVHNLKGISASLQFDNLARQCMKAESFINAKIENNDPLTDSETEKLRLFVDMLGRVKKDIEERYDDTSTEFDFEAAEIKNTGQNNIPVMHKSNSIRVNVAKVDELVESVGEIVLLKNRLCKTLESGDQVSGELFKIGQLLDRATESASKAVLRTRMISIGTIFGKFPRIVRDLAIDLAKEAELSITGSETELDKTMIEGLADPLLHMLRNSLDHGIESLEERIALGKPAHGTISLSAYQDGNGIVIRLKDDGRGMDPEKIVKSAIAKGVITEKISANMNTKEKLALIFTPGFSTAEQVSDISGRGVGMDVVRHNIEDMRGRIEINSRIGKGTTVLLRLPLTLAIIPVLLVLNNKRRYCIPLFSVSKVVAIDKSQISNKSKNAIVEIGNNSYPLLYLCDLLQSGLKPATAEISEPPESEEVDVVLLKIGVRRIALCVEKRLHQQDVLVKSLDTLEGIYNPPYLSGATILEDGELSLILDVAGMARTAPVVETEERSEDKKSVLSKKADHLLLAGFDAGRYILPFKNILSVKIINRAEIKMIGGRMIYKRPGTFLPVTWLGGKAEGDGNTGEDMYLVDAGFEEKNAGLLAMEVIGFVSTGAGEDELQSVNRIDLTAEIENAFTKKDIIRIKKDSKKFKTILLVDDSPTQRNIIASDLASESYEIIQAVDGVDAMTKLAGVDCVITDFEMPNMDGADLTAKLKETNPSLPVIVLTKYSDKKHITRALQAGADRYLVKYDKATLLQSVQRCESDYLF